MSALVIRSACVLACVASFTTAAVMVHRMGSAARAFDAAAKEYRTISNSIDEIQRLRSQREVVGVEASPREDVIARLHAALVLSGQSVSLLREITPGPDVPVADGSGSGSRSSLRRQTVVATVEPVTPLELGRLLSSLRTSEPYWSMESIRMQHVGGENDDTGVYRITLTIGSLYWASEGR